MKTRLIWKKCRLLEDKDAFWIECTDEEVASQIIPLIDDNKIKTVTHDKSINFHEIIERNRGKNTLNKNPMDLKMCNFFLVTGDLELIMSDRWHFPYSGQWNAYNPFSLIDIIDLQSLDDLKNYDTTQFSDGFDEAMYKL